MKKIVFILLIMHLGLLKAQVFNNAYNNYNHIFYRQITDEYLFNYDAFFNTLIIDEDSLIVVFGNTTTPYVAGDTLLRSLFIHKLEKNGNILSSHEILIDSFSVNSMSKAFSFNNKYILVGKAGYSLGKSEALIVQLDSNFNILNYSIFNYGNTTLFYDFTLDFETDFFYVSGNSEIDTTLTHSNYDIFVTKININGLIIDTFQIGGIEDDLSAQIELLPNGNLLIGGLTESQGAGDEDLYLVEIDTLGNVIWEQTYGYPGTDKVYTNLCFEVTEQNEIYMVGSTELMDGNYVGWLIKTDSVGNMLWEKKYDWGEYFDAIVSIKILEDNSLLATVGSHDYDFINSPPPIIRLLKMDTLGNIIWERKLSKYGLNSTDDYAYDLDIMDDGFLVTGYVIGGGVETNGVFHLNDGWLCKTDSCGFTTGAQPEALLTVDSVVGATVYITNLSEDYCTAVLHLSNGDSINIYAYSQYTNGADPTQIQYTFTDTGTYNLTLYTYAGDGIDTFTTQVEITSLTTSISSVNRQLAVLDINVYPNPSKEYFILEANFGMLNQVQHDVNGSSTRGGKLEGGLYTITGQKVQSFNINPNLLQQRIYLNDLANGVYFVNFSYKDIILGTKRISVVK